MKNNPPEFSSARRAMTLCELLVGLTILSVLSIGTTNLIVGGLHTDRMLLDADRQVSEIEFTIRRITHDIRTGAAISVSGTTSITLTSQADPGNNGQTYTIVYSYDSVGQTLSETSSQYGAVANVIAYNVTAFSVSMVTTSPAVISIDMTIASAGNAPATRRTFQVLNRNS